MRQENKVKGKDRKSEPSGKTDKLSESICSRTDVAEILLSMAKDIKRLLEIIEEREKTRKGI